MPDTGTFRVIAIFTSFLLSVILLMFLKVGSSMYGPGGFESEVQSKHDFNRGRAEKIFLINYFT